ncbi:hypothetical protein SCHPADRAFT_899195 [Schizopora paradoxa]|uniref:Uncharacterized protein n=1 Tax=Schizopora paradoxa TaxID=27342 RepID=A0A0H2S588_9AGAM|nr:hypothetical protein SCHPADRAFT_899195 [Schizopora paradoxa]
MSTNAPTRPAHHYLDFLKPRRGVAIVRLKNNGLGAVVFFVVTLLAPGVPSPLHAFWIVLLSQSGSSLRGGKVKAGSGGRILDGTAWTISVVELLVFALLSFNIVQSCFALKYPPAPCNTPATPSHSPAKKIQVPVMSPLGASTSSPNRGPFPSLATPPRLSSSTYQPSPTPSTLSQNYKLSRITSPTSPQQGSSPFNNSFSSSLGSSTSTPFASPLAYRSTRNRHSVVRPLDGSLLTRLGASSQGDVDGDVDEY